MVEGLAELLISLEDKGANGAEMHQLGKEYALYQKHVESLASLTSDEHERIEKAVEKSIDNLKVSKEEKEKIKERAYKELSLKARLLAPVILDQAQVPHSDLVLPSQKVHSGRYIISQWQRIAVGVAVAVVGYDKTGELCLAMGYQKGRLRLAQGYAETPLPPTDYTGLSKAGASRLGEGKKLVKADASLRGAAVREVYEELGVRIKEQDLIALGTYGFEPALSGAPMLDEMYLVILEKPIEDYKLAVTDFESEEDDLSKPKWYRLSTFKKLDTKKAYIGEKRQLIGEEDLVVIEHAFDKLKDEEVLRRCKASQK